MQEFDAYDAICNEIDSLSREEFKEFVYGFMRHSIYDVIEMMDLSDVKTAKDARDWVQGHLV